MGALWFMLGYAAGRGEQGPRAIDEPWIAIPLAVLVLAFCLWYFVDEFYLSPKRYRTELAARQRRNEAESA
jgi:hypothetical protein